MYVLCVFTPRLFFAQESSACPVCGKQVKRVNQHVREVHEESAATCSLCHKTFRTQRLLRCHTRNSHGPALTLPGLKCPACEAVVPKRKLQFHLEIFHFFPADFLTPCPLCGKGVRHVPWHMKKVHKGTDLRTDVFHCRKCRQYLDSRAALLAHDADHVVFPCQLCRRPFVAFMDLCRHLLASHRKVFSLGERVGHRAVERRPFPAQIQDLADFPLHDIPARMPVDANLEDVVDDPDGDDETDVFDEANDCAAERLDISEENIHVVLELEASELDDSEHSELHLSSRLPRHSGYFSPPPNLEDSANDVIFIVSDDVAGLDVPADGDEAPPYSVDEEDGAAEAVDDEAVSVLSPELNISTVITTEPSDPHFICFIDDENRLGKEYWQLIDIRISFVDPE